MGALHAGHISLVGLSKDRADVTVASIFVNPTQFNDKADLEKYPRPIEEDIEKLIDAGCDILFLPTSEEVYPHDQDLDQSYQPGKLAETMEGAFRPGHFAGVAQVVKRLLDIVSPDKLFMGQKDYQQLQIVRDMVNYYKLPVEVVMGKTIRDNRGLALSSRNVRLNKEEKEAAYNFPKALNAIVAQKGSRLMNELIQEAIDHLNEHPLITVEYLEAVKASDLSKVEKLENGGEYAICGVVRIGEIRLLDNVIIA